MIDASVIALARTGERWPTRLAVLGERDFRLTLGAHITSLIGDGIVPVALAFAVLDLTGSATDLGLVLAAGTVPLVVCLLIGGVIADRLSRRRIMIAADLVRLAAQALLGALLLSGTAALWHLAALQAVVGAASGFFNPAASGFVPVVVSSGRLPEANSLRAIGRAFGGISGPLIAGVLVTMAGPGEAILVDAGTYALSAALLARVRVVERLERRRGAFVEELRGGWSEMSSRTWLWGMTVASSLMNMFTATFIVLGALVAKRDLGGAGAWGVILAARAAGQLAGGVISLRVRPRRPLMLATLGAELVAAPLLLLAVRAPVVLVASAAAIAGIGVVLFNTAWLTTVQQQVPIHALSRVSAYDWLGSYTCQPLGFALVGAVAGGIGVTATLLAAGLLHLGSVASLFLVRDVRTIRAES